MEEPDRMRSHQTLCENNQKNQKNQKDQNRSRCSTLKMFIAALSLVYFSKALAGSYMKSSITQIERRFDLSSSLTGLIDGGFEMGNLLFLAVVSHFGARLHRPRLIALGCLLMSAGALCTGLPHFFMGRYTYDSVIRGSQNDSGSLAACQSAEERAEQTPSGPPHSGLCQKDSSIMWVYVLLGNVLRGIGETPVTPLGISYIDDFSKAENSPFYIACLQTITLLGPMFGFLLGSYCAKLYVDVGLVDLDKVNISPKDSRWVGAWWLGFLVSAALLLLAGFLPSLRRLLGTPSYFLLLCGSVLKFNSFIGLLTFKAKYMEQQFGLTASRANFLIGVLNLPVVALGIFLGGVLMKRWRVGVVAGAQMSFVTSFMAYLLLLLHFITKCDNLPVAGLTAHWNGTPAGWYQNRSLLSECNRECSCSAEEWDPVCSDSGTTYTSPCMAGCTASTGYGKDTVFHNCSCVSSSSGPVGGGSTAVRLGPCPRPEACSAAFTSYMTVSVLSSFINAVGITPGYMVIIRCISPDLKSLALGIQALTVRTLGGIPAPVYFGALIDSTCLKWAMKNCGGRGACRLYDSDMYRMIFLGLITCLSGSSYAFIIAVIFLLRRQFLKPERDSRKQNISTDLKTLSSPTMDLQTSCMDQKTSSMDLQTSSMDQKTSCMDQKTSSMDLKTLSNSSMDQHISTSPSATLQVRMVEAEGKSDESSPGEPGPES